MIIKDANYVDGIIQLLNHDNPDFLIKKIARDVSVLSKQNRKNIKSQCKGKSQMPTI